MTYSVYASINATKANAMDSVNEGGTARDRKRSFFYEPSYLTQNDIIEL